MNISRRGSQPAPEQEYRTPKTGGMGNARKGPTVLNPKVKIIKLAATKEVLLPPIINVFHLWSVSV